MDINFSEIIDDSCSIAEMGQRIFEQIIVTASGQKRQKANCMAMVKMSLCLGWLGR